MARRRSCSRVARSSVSARISGSNMTNLRTGSSLARWRAISASLSRSPAYVVAAPADRQAEAGADGDLLAVEVERHGDRGGDPGGDPLRLAHAAHRTEEHAELVAAEAGDHVGRAGGRHEPVRDLGQQQVAGGVPEALVDHLEPVEVEQDQRDPRTAGALPSDARRGVQVLGHPVQQGGPVGQAREHVVEGGVGALQALGLGTLEQAGVVEGDRRQLGEPRQRLELALAERPAAVAGREPDHAQHLAVGGQRHRAHGAERLGVEPAAPGSGRRRSRRRSSAGPTGPPSSRCPVPWGRR